ncbi:hypothetical protein KP509_1Z285500 [Ceratopteris richardii]|nr:hypothetical protein KP509_1Z285500 [Ceratopteris richardii]
MQRPISIYNSGFLPCRLSLHKKCLIMHKAKDNGNFTQQYATSREHVKLKLLPVADLGCCSLRMQDESP